MDWGLVIHDSLSPRTHQSQNKITACLVVSTVYDQ